MFPTMQNGKKCIRSYKKEADTFTLLYVAIKRNAFLPLLLSSFFSKQFGVFWQIKVLHDNYDVIDI